MERGADNRQAPEDQPTAAVPEQRPPGPPRPRPPQRPQGPLGHSQGAPRHRFGVQDARNPQFTLVFRGYEREAVDRYVAEVIELITELEATQTREGTVQRALEEVGEQTSSILQRAHETAEEIASRARSQAEGRVARAERDAEQTVAQAEAEAQRIRADVRDVWQQRSRLIEELRRLSDEVLTVADDALERLAPPADEPPTAETETEPPPPVTIAAPAGAAEEASAASPQPTGSEPTGSERAGGERAMRERAPTPPAGGAGKPARRTLGPIGDPLDVPPVQADPPVEDGPAVRRVGPERRQG